jgi:uncharacterized protein (DUF58 family)
MLTVRSSLILAASIWMLFLSIMDRHEPLALFSLSLLLWVWLEWIFFQRVRAGTALALQSCVRSIENQADDNVTMVADQTYQVRLSGELPSVMRGYRLVIQDTVPDTFDVVEGESFLVVDSVRSQKLLVNYSVSSPICGRVVFPGIRVEVSDFWGFFRTEQFIPVNQQASVLPYLIRPQTTVSVLKRNNLQRHIGHHRHKSAGVSSELLGIRDYRIGDPPRTIAWKPTARLGKLMTCEFENEVPIRATLIVDLAPYQFQGRPGPSAADRAIMACASIAKLLLSDRDPVAALLLKSESTQRVNHGSGERQLTRLLQYLLVASNPNPPLDQFWIDDLVKLIFDNGSRRFPDLFDEHFNRGPARRRRFRLRPNRSDQIRRSVAIVLEHLLKLEPGLSTRMQFDDDSMRRACLKYVEEFSVVASSSNVAINPPWSQPGRWHQASRRMTKYLSDNLLEARTRAKDNELFVLIAPEPVDREGLETIESAIKTVVSARHRVIYVAPAVPKKLIIHDPLAAEIMKESARRDVRGQDSELRLGLAKLGATFARMDDPSLMRIVAMEIGLLQSGKTRGHTLPAGR